MIGRTPARRREKRRGGTTIRKRKIQKKRKTAMGRSTTSVMKCVSHKRGVKTKTIWRLGTKK